MKLYLKVVAFIFALIFLIGFLIPALFSSATDIGPILGGLLIAAIPATVYYFWAPKKKESKR